MSATTVVVIAVIIWLIAMAASWCVRWMNVLSAIFVAGVIVIGVAVSWQRVQQYRNQRDAATAFYNRAAPSPATAPPPDHAPKGT